MCALCVTCGVYPIFPCKASVFRAACAGQCRRRGNGDGRDVGRARCGECLPAGDFLAAEGAAAGKALRGRGGSVRRASRGLCGRGTACGEKARLPGGRFLCVRAGPLRGENSSARGRGVCRAAVVENVAVGTIRCPRGIIFFLACCRARSCRRRRWRFPSPSRGGVRGVVAENGADGDEEHGVLHGNHGGGHGRGKPAFGAAFHHIKVDETGVQKRARRAHGIHQQGRARGERAFEGLLTVFQLLRRGVGAAARYARKADEKSFRGAGQQFGVLLIQGGGSGLPWRR